MCEHNFESKQSQIKLEEEAIGYLQAQYMNSSRGVGRGCSKGSDEPPSVSNQDLIIASYLGSFNTKSFQV